MKYKHRKNQKLRYIIQWLVAWVMFALGVYFGLPYVYEFEWIVRLFIALNVSTVLVMGMDKLSAIVQIHRVPEMAFYVMTFLGGSIGMLVGMYTFRHKTRKQSFQIVVGLYVVQIVYILIVLTNGIENGTDKVYERFLIGRDVTRSTILYSAIAFSVMFIFNIIAEQIMTATIAVG